MADQSLEDRTVEISGIPDSVEDEFLSLYFENRRSGGGALASLRRSGDRAVLVYEQAEVAARVLSKREHAVMNATLAVRKPPPKDPTKLLLCGVNPHTPVELVELYVENVTGVASGNFSIFRSDGGDVALVHFHLLPSEDFHSFYEKITKKPLDGATIHPEQVQHTDSVLVQNLNPSTSEDMLLLYFESKRGSNADVKEISVMDGSARISFEDIKAVERVLSKTHALEGNMLQVQPCYDFLLKPVVDGVQPEPLQTVDSVEKSPVPPEHPVVAPQEQASGGTRVEELLLTKASSTCISISDPLKLSLFKDSQHSQQLQVTHPGCEITLREALVQISGPNQLQVDQLKTKILDFLGGFAQVNITFERKRAAFLSKKEVKEKVLLTLRQQSILAVYTVSECTVAVVSLSLTMVNQASNLIRSLVWEFRVEVQPEQEGMLFSKAWLEFVSSLDLCSLDVSCRGDRIDVLTLSGMEGEKRMSIMEFLSSTSEMESVIAMEPGMLKYIQIHCHQLLADVDEVSIFPLEGKDICGFRLHGNATACQMTDELLRSVVASVLTRTIHVSQPGVARFLVEEDGTSILKEMQVKFQVYISLDKVYWEPLEEQDVFEYAWTLISQQNFQRNSLEGQSLSQHGTDVNANTTSVPDRDLIEEAKRLFSVIDMDQESTGATGVNEVVDLTEEDLYTASEDTLTNPSNITASPTVDDTILNVPLPKPLGEEMDEETLEIEDVARATDLEEDAMLSLAIQYSLETNRTNSEDELQKVLELSRREVKQDHGDGDDQLEKAIEVSLQDAIKAANNAEIAVFAGYNCDLIRVDIALGKKVGLRQCEENVEHSCLKSLSDHGKKCIEVIRRKHAVDVQVQGTTAIVSGFRDYVQGAVSDIKHVMKRISATANDSEILRTIQWVWYDAKGLPVPYSPKTIVFLENVWKMKQKKVDVVFDHAPYVIDFEKMQEYDITSGRSAVIARKLLSSADLYMDVPEPDCGLLSSLPEASKVDEDSDEFQDVIKEFYNTIHEYHSKIRIVKVEKVMNSLLLSQYKLKKASLMQTTTEHEVERTLYHGTSESSVKEICVHGFNRSFCGKNATVYGQGVYFAVNSAISVQDQYSPPNADGHKFVFMAKVLTGDYAKGRHEMKTAPLKESSDIPLRYHSVVDRVDSPTLFVIFNDTQAYPEYVITCQKVQR